MIISILHKNSTILLLFSALIISGCGRKPTVVSTSYQQEMVNFINNTQEGQELFSFYLYPERSESFFQNGFYYFYELESGRRYYQVDIGGQASMYGFEDIYDAVVRINDTLYGTLHRIVGADTSIYRHLEIAVTRYAYFLKLFTDDNSFHGWRFWGYGVDNLDPRQYGTLLPGSGGSFSAFQSGDVIDVKSTIRSKMGFYFIFKNNIVKLPRGDTLTYRSVNRDILFAETNDGVRRNISLSSDGSNYTGGWRTPPGSDKFYRLITFEGPYFERIDTVTVGGMQQIYTTRIRYSDVIIPFKVDI